MPVTHGVAGSSPVQTALLKKLCVVKLEKIPIFSTSEKLSSETEGFFCFINWQHIGNKPHVFLPHELKAKSFHPFLIFYKRGGFQGFVFLTRVSCVI